MVVIERPLRNQVRLVFIIAFQAAEITRVFTVNLEFPGQPFSDKVLF